MEKKDNVGSGPIGAPLDGGPAPGATLSNTNPNASKSLEIGLIIGIVALVALSVALLFYWRVRKNKALTQQKDDAAETGTAGSPTSTSEHHVVVDDIHHGGPVHEGGGGGRGGRPVPPPKDERRSASEDTEVIHNTSGLVIERSTTKQEDVSRGPAWSAWGNRNAYSGVEEHEIVNRV